MLGIVGEMIDRGYLKVYDVHGRSCLGVPFLPFQEKHNEFANLQMLEPEMSDDEEIKQFGGVGHKLDMDSVLYKSTIVEDTITINGKEDIAGFLLDNGITIMDGKFLSGEMKKRLATTMSLTECSCIAEYNLSEGVRSKGLELREFLSMQPGDAILHLKMESDFEEYLSDPSAYQEKLKSEMLMALGLDPDQVPGARDAIVILKAWQGSINIWARIKGCLVAAASLLRHVAEVAVNRTREFVQFCTQCTCGFAQRVTHCVQCTCGFVHSRLQGAQSLHTTSAPRGAPSARTTSAPRGVPSARATSGPQGAPSARTKHPCISRGHSNTWVNTPAGRSRQTPKSQTTDGTAHVGRAALGASIPSSSQVATGPRRPLDNVCVTTTKDGDWTVVGHFSTDTSNRCFMRQTLFQVSNFAYKEAQALKVGDVVLGASGNPLLVSSHEIHKRQDCTLITLRTPQSEITVTDNHRIMVPTPNGLINEKEAGQLNPGDDVICGLRSQKLTKVRRFPTNVDLVEIRFMPDDPIETRVAPRWGILTKGAPFPLVTRNTFLDATRAAPAKKRASSI